MWKIIFIIQKPRSILTDSEHRKLLGDCLITISPSLDCISNECIEKTHIALLANVPLLGTSHWSKLSSSKIRITIWTVDTRNVCLSILKVVWNRQPMRDQYWSTKSKYQFCTLRKSLFLNPPKRKNCMAKCDWCTFYFLAPYLGSL